MLNLAVLALAVAFQPTSAEAQNTAFKQAIAQASANDEDIAAFYKERGYKSLWTGNADRKRRKAFLEALRTAPEHGLPEGR